MSLPPDRHRCFGPDFVWGVATSAYQIEGGARIDGKGPSIWDRFCEQSGRIADGSSGEVACDHVHRWAEDLDIVRDLGVVAYRFSVSWPRVQPAGQGGWNEAGLGFYERLVDGLLSRGVRPYLTLNHWDLPDALQQRGGWACRDTVHRFVEYAQGVARRLGDRVAAITTHNEPWVIAHLGHETGSFAPGVADRATAMQVSHHLLLSHGMALQALRADGCRSRLGIVLNLAPVYPASERAEDVAAARLEDGLLRRWYMDPLLRGAYPADVLAHLGADAPRSLPGDAAAIATPMDFLGINYYSRNVASAGGGWDKASSGRVRTEMDWEVFPEGLTDLLLRLDAEYTLPPVVVTENGAAFHDELRDGRVHDAARTDYIARHIDAVAEAMQGGVDVAGYMVWSLMDNFEWTSGYARRFGIVHVDYATQRRTWKDSALWYRAFLRRWRSRSAAPERAPVAA
jgi:beta-glucosidase